MIQTLSLSPGITLRCVHSTRFKQGRLTVQFLLPMSREEASKNALLPAVLLRGTEKYPDMQSISRHLDGLYGASAGELVRRIGDWQTTGFACSFTEDRFALPGDAIFAPVAAFLGELLRRPLTENGVFCGEFVESEKRNLLSELDAIRNDKAAYAASRMLEILCDGDSFAIPRLGDRETLSAITARSLYDHYQKVLRQCPVELFYVGSVPADRVAQALQPLFAGLDRNYVNLPDQRPFPSVPCRRVTEKMDIAQSRLNLAFVTDITCSDSRYPALMLLNTVYGGGAASKLFTNVREKMSLCYSVGSDVYGTKGIATVAAGIDGQKGETARAEILRQLQLCRDGEISDGELHAARQVMLSALNTVHDSTRSIEGYYSTALLTGRDPDLDAYRAALLAVTKQDLVEAAGSLTLCCDYFLEGV